MQKDKNEKLNVAKLSAVLFKLRLPRFFNKFFSVLSFSCLILTFSFLFGMPVYSQIEDADAIPKDIVPPPLNIISKDESKQLDAETKMKKRIKLAIELMEARIAKSEQFLEQTEYQQSLDELGKFQGILINTLKFLNQNDGRSGVLNNYKRLEMNLRDFIPRLEIVRREIPFKYGYHVKQMIFYVRDARTRALNPLFDDTVLSESSL